MSAEARECSCAYTSVSELEYVLPGQAGGVFQFQVTKGPGGKTETWFVDAKTAPGGVTRGGQGQPRAVVRECFHAESVER